MSDKEFQQKQKARRLVKVQMMNRYRRQQHQKYVQDVKQNNEG